MALTISLASFLIMTMSTIVMTEWTMMIMPPSTMIEIEEANGLNRIMIPQIKSMMPSKSQRYQLETLVLTDKEMLMTLTLDRIIQMASAIAKTVVNTFGIAISNNPAIIEMMPDAIP